MTHFEAPTYPILPADLRPAVHWSDALLLGFGPMDSRHEEFVQVVSALQAAGPNELSAALDAVAEHLKAHFEEEERWMNETVFPARACHAEEHAAVLASVGEVQALLAAGDDGECHRLADELARWFPGHADYMDAALAHWMCQRKLGGTPVVIRRSISPATPPESDQEAG